MEKFWELLSTSVIVQGLLTLGVTFFVCLQAYRGMEVNEQFWTLLGLAWGFYFGTKIQQMANRSLKK